MNTVVGILAIQGGVHAHQAVIESLGYSTHLVKLTSDLDKVDRLIIPGGESTTLTLLLKKHQVWDALKQFCQTQPVFGTCAGSILLAKNITPSGDTLGIIDMTINRNGYGRQLDSFEDQINIAHSALNLIGKVETIHGIFIRAPIIESVGKDVEILAIYQDQPVVVQHKKSLACTFHPELTRSTMIHQYFMSL